MAENSRSIAKYQPVSSAEPYTVSDGRNHEPLYEHDRSTSYEGHQPAGHQQRPQNIAGLKSFLSGGLK
jgi:hypothetical protein